MVYVYCIVTNQVSQNAFPFLELKHVFLTDLLLLENVRPMSTVFMIVTNDSQAKM